MGVLMTDDLPEEISERLQSFLVRRPGWTQARVMQNALSLFLLQNGVNDRAVTRMYLESMFPESMTEKGGVQ